MNYTLITGASSGIGKELAWLFAKDGHNLILVSRQEDKLQYLANELKEKYTIETLIIPLDIGNTDAAKEIYRIVNERSCTLDYLVNNAGYLVKGDFNETPWEKEQSLIQMQCLVYTELTKFFLPVMLKQNKGGILNIGSTGSFVPGPHSAVYCAAKSFVLSFSEALAEEVKGSGVVVTALCPGGTDTAFHGTDRNKRPSYLSLMDASKVARIGYKALMKGKRVVIPGFNNKMQVFFTRFVPRNIITRVTGKILAKQ